LLLVVLGRDTGPPRLSLTTTGFAALEGWMADRTEAAIPAFLRSCTRFLSAPDTAPFALSVDGSAFGRIGDWRPLCREAAGLRPGDGAAARRFFETRFAPLSVADYRDEQGLFTGYFEIELRGSRRRGGRFQTPIYRRPPDPTLATRYARAEIDAGALAGHDLAFVWVDNPIDAFFLQIQGSGTVRCGDGRIIRLGYDGDNGRAYVPIGRLLVERGEIPRNRLSMAAIRAWMLRYPKRGASLRREDPSYVYFRELHGAGPVGAEQVVLTPERSIAVDPAFVPLGAPVWLQAEERFRPAEDVRRLVVAQDAGGAIKGPVRGDLFWGTGAEAGREAGAMDAYGRYFILVPRRVAARAAGQGAD
jgi:membrane-bound lytic murein transglycosylase A